MLTPGLWSNAIKSLLLVLIIGAQAFAQRPEVPVTPEQAAKANYNDPIRQEAMRLFEQNRMTEVVPMLERVVEKYPEDVVAHERLGAALIGRAETQADPEKKKADRRQARAQLLRAKALGDDSDLCNTFLAM